MDCGDGTFRQLSNEDVKKLADHEQEVVFHVGEIVNVKGSRFRVQSIGTRFMKLKLLPATRSDEKGIPAAGSRI